VKALIILVLASMVFGAGGYFTYEIFIHPKVALEAEKQLPLPPPPPDPSLPDFEKAVAVRRDGTLLEARAALSAFVEHNPQSSKIEDARDLLGEVNSAIFLSPVAAPEKEVYIVQKNDVIGRVALRMHTSAELLMRSNNLQTAMLRIGQKLTVSPGEFSLVISRKSDKVVLLNKGRFFKQYAIRSWSPILAKKMVTGGRKIPPLPKQMGKVTEKLAWLNGSRVLYSDKGYINATHWIEINIPGCTLYGDPGANENAPNAKPPGGGIVLSPDAPGELAAMLNKGAPVTLE
jgi:LysM repeat protein